MARLHVSSSAFYIVKLPRYQVLELPPGAELLASSATAAHEVWTVADRVLAFQGHPEMAPEVMLAKVHSTLSSNGCAIPLSLAVEK